MVIAEINELLLIKCNPCIKSLCMKRRLNSWVIIAGYLCELLINYTQFQVLNFIKQVSNLRIDSTRNKYILRPRAISWKIRKYIVVSFPDEGQIIFSVELTPEEITDDLKTLLYFCSFFSIYYFLLSHFLIPNLFLCFPFSLFIEKMNLESYSPKLN